MEGSSNLHRSLHVGYALLCGCKAHLAAQLQTRCEFRFAGIELSGYGIYIAVSANQLTHLDPDGAVASA